MTAMTPAQVTVTIEHALWVLTEHNALHFGESHNTVIEGRKALALLRSQAAPSDARGEAVCDNGTCDFASSTNGYHCCVNCGRTKPHGYSQPPSPATTLVSAIVDAGEAGELDDDAIDADNERMLAEPPSPAADEYRYKPKMAPSPAAGDAVEQLRQQHPMWNLLQAYGDACQLMGEHQGREQAHRRSGDITAVNSAWSALWDWLEHTHASPGDV